MQLGPNLSEDAQEELRSYHQFEARFPVVICQPATYRQLKQRLSIEPDLDPASRTERKREETEPAVIGTVVVRWRRQSITDAVSIAPVESTRAALLVLAQGPTAALPIAAADEVQPTTLDQSTRGQGHEFVFDERQGSSVRGLGRYLVAKLFSVDHR